MQEDIFLCLFIYVILFQREVNPQLNKSIMSLCSVPCGLMQPHAWGKLNRLAAKSNHLPDPFTDRTEFTQTPKLIFGQPRS